MAHPYEAEIRVACAEGVVARDEAEALAAEAAAAVRSPLDLLRDRDRISDETLAALREAAASEQMPAAAFAPTLSAPLPAGDADPGATALPGVTGASEGATAFPIPGWDRYEPVRFLGQGGMGKVFLARDTRLGREVAIKFVRGDDPAYVTRLLYEARAQARVDHERVCKVYEVGEARGQVYIAMQYIAGEPLVALARGLTVEQKAMIVRDAALGVHEAHRTGIIHRGRLLSLLSVGESGT